MSGDVFAYSIVNRAVLTDLPAWEVFLERFSVPQLLSALASLGAVPDPLVVLAEAVIPDASIADPVWCLIATGSVPH